MFYVNDLHRYLKCRSSPQVFFKHFLSKNQLPGLSVIVTFVQNRLTKTPGVLHLKKEMNQYFIHQFSNYEET